MTWLASFYYRPFVTVLAEQFRAETFRQSLRKLFARDASGALDMYFNATFSVFCVPQVSPHACCLNVACVTLIHPLTSFCLT